MTEHFHIFSSLLFNSAKDRLEVSFLSACRLCRHAIICSFYPVFLIGLCLSHCVSSFMLPPTELGLSLSTLRTCVKFRYFGLHFCKNTKFAFFLLFFKKKRRRRKRRGDLPVRLSAGFQSEHRGWRARAGHPSRSWSWNRWCRTSWWHLSPRRLRLSLEISPNEKSRIWIATIITYEGEIYSQWFANLKLNPGAIIFSDYFFIFIQN